MREPPREAGYVPASQGGELSARKDQDGPAAGRDRE